MHTSDGKNKLQRNTLIVFRFCRNILKKINLQAKSDSIKPVYNSVRLKFEKLNRN